MKDFSDYYRVSGDGCWLWKGARSSQGRYGCLRIAGKTLAAHRHSYELHKGDIPDGMFVCHRCDVPECVNPDHLFLGTAKDNFDDMVTKGRGVVTFMQKDEKGAKNGNAKLSEQQVIAIRQARQDGATYRMIRERFGIKSNGHVRNIITGKLWGDAAS